MSKQDKIPGAYRKQPPAVDRLQRATKPVGRNRELRNTSQWTKISKLIRSEVTSCQLCGREGQSVDHLDENSGNNTRANLVVLCFSCHSWKSKAFAAPHSLFTIRTWDDFLSEYNRRGLQLATKYHLQEAQSNDERTKQYHFANICHTVRLGFAHKGPLGEVLPSSYQYALLLLTYHHARGTR